MFTRTDTLYQIADRVLELLVECNDRPTRINLLGSLDIVVSSEYTIAQLINDYRDFCKGVYLELDKGFSLKDPTAYGSSITNKLLERWIPVYQMANIAYESIDSARFDFDIDEDNKIHRMVLSDQELDVLSKNRNTVLGVLGLYSECIRCAVIKISGYAPQVYVQYQDKLKEFYDAPIKLIQPDQQTQPSEQGEKLSTFQRLFLIRLLQEKGLFPKKQIAQSHKSELEFIGALIGLTYEGHLKKADTDVKKLINNDLTISQYRERIKDIRTVKTVLRAMDLPMVVTLIDEYERQAIKKLESE